jgi:hypothetical protein
MIPGLSPEVIALIVLIIQTYVAARDRSRADLEKAAAAKAVAEEAREASRVQKEAAERLAKDTRDAAALVAVKAEAVRQALADGVVISNAKLEGISHQTDEVHGLVNSAAEKARQETEAGRKENRKLAAMVAALRKEISELKVAAAGKSKKGS